MRTMLKSSELQPGDVLLYSGSSFLDSLIRFFDGSEYNHSSIFDGTDVAEAVAAGVVSDSIAESIQDQDYVDIYRFNSDDGTPLGGPGYPPDPVLGRIAYYVAQHDRYAYEQLLLLALLTTTRRLPFIGWVPGLASLLRTILDGAAEALNQIIAAGKQPMICSELVYRCYSEAGDKYGLEIVGAEIVARNSLYELALRGSTSLGPGDQESREIQDLLAASQTFLRRYAIARRPRAPLSVAQVVADFVTPRDLKTSPNLLCIGRLNT